MLGERLSLALEQRSRPAKGQRGRAGVQALPRKPVAKLKGGLRSSFASSICTGLATQPRALLRCKGGKLGTVGSDAQSGLRQALGVATSRRSLLCN